MKNVIQFIVFIYKKLNMQTSYLINKYKYKHIIYYLKQKEYPFYSHQLFAHE